MIIRIHNKFEILLNDKKYIAQNTVLPPMFERLSTLSHYTKYMAFGTGTAAEDLSNSYQMLHAVKVVETGSLEKQTDATNGTLFSKKQVYFPDSEAEFSFSEIGFATSNDAMPVLVNHAFVLDSNNNVITITKSAGDSLTVYATVYIEFDANVDILPTLGDNQFILALLGEDVFSNFPTFKLAKGSCLLPNIAINRGDDLISAVQVEPIVSHTETSFSIEFSAGLGAGEVYELLLICNDIPVLRYNTINTSTENVSSTVTGDDSRTAVLTVSNFIELVSVTDANGDAVDAEAIRYGKLYGGYCDSLITLPYLSTTPRFVSKEGDRIAFVVDGRVDIYDNINYNFVKLNTSSLTMNSIVDIIMFDNLLFAFQSVSPFVSSFRYTNGQFVQLENPILSIMSSLGWSVLADFDITKRMDGKYIAGMMSTNTDSVDQCYAVVMNMNDSGDLVYESKYSSGINAVEFCVASLPCGDIDAQVMCASQLYISTNTPAIRYFLGGIWRVVASTVLCNMVKGMQKVELCPKSFLIRRTSATPHVPILIPYKPKSYNLVSSSTLYHIYTNPNMKYLMRKNLSTGVWQGVFMKRDMSGLMFTGSLPEYFTQENIVDVQPMNDTFIFFMADGSVKTVNVLEDMAYLFGVPNGTAVTVVSKRGIIVGTGSTGVTATISISVT